MSKTFSRTSLRLFDLAILSLAYCLAFMIRFEWEPPPEMWKRLVATLPYVVAFQYGVLVAFGIPRFAWRYVGLKEVTRIFVAGSVHTLVLLGVRIAAAAFRPSFDFVSYAIVPVGVIVIDYTLSFLGIAGARTLRRLAAEKAASDRLPPAAHEPVPTLLIGAGQAGLLVAREITARPDLGIRPVGFVDDDPAKVGTSLHGIRVLGTSVELGALARRHAARQALITIANAPGRAIRRIHETCEHAQLPTKIIPGLFEIVGGNVNLSRIRDVAIDDLLRRDLVVLDEPAIGGGLRDSVVMVTGAGGSIGSELCRQICRYSPRQLLLVEQAENGLFQIHRELREATPSAALEPCIADICDSRRMESLFARYRPQVVFHAAAHKHVPMMEYNPAEAVKNNVFGTRKVADLAHAYHTDRFVLISTDKAVNPTSVMGATKRVAEIYVQALSQRSDTRYVTVRFGNVLGSAGSVVPIFKEQIAAGGPVTVTHPDMKRYFMTIPEACQLVLQAAIMGEGGEIYVLDMGEPVAIVDLARDLIRLSGLTPGVDIEIVFTGLRPGEKLFEQLSVAEESADKTKHPKIFIGRLTPHPIEQVRSRLEALHRIINDDDGDRIRGALQQVVPEYRPSGSARNGTAVSAQPVPASPVSVVGSS